MRRPTARSRRDGARACAHVARAPPRRAGSGSERLRLGPSERAGEQAEGHPGEVLGETGEGQVGQPAVLLVAHPVVHPRIAAVAKLEERGVDHEHFGAVAHDPDVVLDLEVAAVEGKDPARRNVLDHGAFTIDRRRLRPSGATSVFRSRADHDDRAKDLAPLHLGESLLDVFEADCLAHEAVEVEAPLEVEVDQHREVARG